MISGWLEPMLDAFEIGVVAHGTLTISAVLYVVFWSWARRALKTEATAVVARYATDRRLLLDVGKEIQDVLQGIERRELSERDLDEAYACFLLDRRVRMMMAKVAVPVEIERGRRRMDDIFQDQQIESWRRSISESDHFFEVYRVVDRPTSPVQRVWDLLRIVWIRMFWRIRLQKFIERSSTDFVVGISGIREAIAANRQNEVERDLFALHTAAASTLVKVLD